MEAIITLIAIILLVNLINFIYVSIKLYIIKNKDPELYNTIVQAKKDYDDIHYTTDV